jgi:CelD/BcsL family acetyltransferase involved in cellulose biosynthesis
MPLYDVELIALPPRTELQADWRALEARAQPNFYTSWSWIGCWLDGLPADLDLQLWRARRDGEVVGLGLLVRRWRKRGVVPVCEAWYLHATGDFTHDVVWVEHNDLLVDACWGDEVRAAMVAHWRSRVSGVAELHCPGLVGPGWPAVVGEGLERVADVQQSCCVTLQDVRDHKLDFMPLVSSHSRRLIRRSLKEYQTLGEVRVLEATSPEQALEFLDRLGALHRRRWQTRGEPGVFGQPHFLAFHRRLIERSLPRGEVQLLCVKAGDHDIGLLYSFVLAGRVYVYQSGFDYALLAKHGRPGLVTHTLAVQHNAALGHEVYDLMAGESAQYKQTLSNRPESMTWLVLRTPALRFRLERRLHRLATSLPRRAAAPLPAAGE